MGKNKSYQAVTATKASELSVRNPPSCTS